MWNKNEVKVNFIRHGKTLLNERHCYIGVTDDSLSEAGMSEILEKKMSGIYPEAERIFVSPMKRCVETATLIYDAKAQVKIDEFREMDFGSFEGKCYDELKDNLYYRKWIDESRGETDKEILSQYSGLSDPEKVGIVLPEKQVDFSRRVIVGFEKALLLSKDAKSLSTVVHGGTIMAILSTYLNDNYYKFMVSPGEGLEASIEYSYDNGNIKISHFSINNWIRA